MQNKIIDNDYIRRENDSNNIVKCQRAFNIALTTGDYGACASLKARLQDCSMESIEEFTSWACKEALGSGKLKLYQYITEMGKELLHYPRKGKK